MNRCNQRQNGLQRCFRAEGHVGAHEFNPDESKERKVNLALTVRMALKLRSMCRQEQRKSRKEQERNTKTGWKPEPGKFDANQMRIEMMEDIIKQLEAQANLPKEMETQQ